MIAVIGGSGFTLQTEQPLEQLQTPFGVAWLTAFLLGDKEAVFLPRHGPRQALPPHRVNYRANLWALKERGVTDIFASFSVGSLKGALQAGTLVLLDQFLDFTKSRLTTFFDGEDGRIVHAEMTYPYCPRLRALLAEAAEATDVEMLPKGTYVCVEGPRFETAAEIAMFGTIGGDVIGMTGVPEVVLARELGICFAGLALATNLGAGLSPTPPSHHEVIELMSSCSEQVWSIFEQAASRWTFQNCACRKAAGQEMK